jgi:hypothetical protein
MYANRLLYNYYHIATTSAGVCIIVGSGVLHTVNINTPVAGQLVQLYDGVNATATSLPIALITVAATTAPVPPYIYDVAYANGLVLISTTGAADLTIAYK